MFFSASSGWGSVPFLANSTAPSTISCTSSSSCCQSSGGDLELLAEAHDRVALGGLVAVFLGAVDLRVADVVAVHPVGLDVEEDRACAGAHVLERLARLLVDLGDVLAVDLDRVHVVGESPLGHVVPDRRVLPARRRLGPLVVLADEERLGLPELRQVERLVEGAGVGRAVAEERDRDARLVAELEGKAAHRPATGARRRRRRSRRGCRARRRRGASSRRSRASSPPSSRRAQPSARSGACRARACGRGRGGSSRRRRRPPSPRRPRPRLPPGRSRRAGSPGSSPARKRSSTFSSNRRISSISRRKSRSLSSERARFFSTLAMA